MNDLQLFRKERFNDIECDLWRNETDEMFMTREQIGNALEYSNPSDGIKNIHLRNKERLDKFSVKVKLSGTDGKQYDTYLYSSKGVYEICRWSKQSKANDFYDWVYDLLENIRLGKVELKYNVPKTYADALKLAANLQEKIEEQQPKVELYDSVMDSTNLMNFIQLADSFGVCGRNTLLDIMRQEKVLMSGENTKNIPYSRYLKSGAFKVKITPRRTDKGIEEFCTPLGTAKALKIIQKILKKRNLLEVCN